MREYVATGKTVEEAIENGCRELGLSREDVSVYIIDLPAKKFFKTVPAKVRISSSVQEEDSSLSGTADKPMEAGRNLPQEKADVPEQVIQPLPTQPVETKKVEIEKPAAFQTAPKESLPLQDKLSSAPTEPLDRAEYPNVEKAVLYLNEIFSAMQVHPDIQTFKQGDAVLLRVEGASFADRIDIKGETIQALSYLTERSANRGVDKKDKEYLRLRLDVEGYRSRRETELTDLARQVARDVLRNNRHRTLQPMNAYERLVVHTTIGGIEGVYSESIGTDNNRRIVIKSQAPQARDGGEWRIRKEEKTAVPPEKVGSYKPKRFAGDNRKGKERSEKPRSSTPEREYADSKRTSGLKPQVPKRREAISDGEDLPLYGKIDFK